MDKFKLAEYIAAKYPGEVTPMKLQKLLYYCYAWQLVAKEKQFNAAFEAWEHGPVEPEIYHEYKKFGRKPIEIDGSLLSPSQLIDFILDSYAVYSALELSKTTHFETPWKKYKGTAQVIPDLEFIEFYSKEPFSKNIPLDDKKPYYPPKTSSHYSFTFDMGHDYVPVFECLQEYLDAFEIEDKRLADIMERHYGFQN